MWVECGLHNGRMRAADVWGWRKGELKMSWKNKTELVVIRRVCVTKKTNCFGKRDLLEIKKIQRLMV